MNYYCIQMDQGSVKARDLCDWMLSVGMPAITTEDAAYLLGVPADQVRQRLASPRGKGLLVSPARGLWVPVPADRRSWGAPEPMAYIDAMMGFLGCDYCVGWLSAASLHGASHQAPQVFQVAAPRPLRGKEVGRSRLAFLARSYVGELPVQNVSTAAGRAKVASPAATMLMLAGDPLEAGGLDNAATAIVEMAQERPEALDELASIACLFPASAPRRVGWILEELGGFGPLDRLAEACSARESSFSVLSPHAPRGGRIDARWGLELNRKVEPDL